MSSRGLTLIEVLVATSISSLVLLIVGGLYLALLHIDRRSQTTRDLGEISIAMDSLTTSLREASRHGGDVVVWDDSAGGRNRKIIAVMARRQIGWTYFIYDRGRREFRRVESTDAAPATPPLDAGRVLARNVIGVEVTHEDDLYSVRLVAEKNGQRIRLQTQVWPRNE
ncbi:MAG TPA: prepilin-type N-terminal cleavage/methylation domain-containing protein [bacterium]|jgi:prepilin-type N-terminal cleavage/methylation domain-containing protein